MTDTRKFFTSAELKSVLRELAIRYQNPSLADAERVGLFGQVLISMLNDADDWDRSCQYTIRRHGSNFQSTAGDLRTNAKADDLDLLKAYAYVFLVELDLSIHDQLEDTLRQFKESALKEFRGRDDRAGLIVKIGTDQLPLAILKDTLNAPGIGNFKAVGELSTSIENRVANWTAQLTAHQEKVDELRANLERYEHAYNFVGLYQGFSNMENTIKSELAKQRRNMILFGILMLFPALIDLSLITLGKVDFSTNKLATLIGGGAVSLTCTLIFLYFFRIVLRDVDSKDAQLVQVRLRMTLCQFIQDYAKYAAEIRQKNPEVLSKFESLIFSGIVGTQDKLPSTFDGLEQLGALLKTAKG
jgi:hypothetical protein